MGSATASPETSPTRADPTRRLGNDVYPFKVTGEEHYSVGENGDNFSYYDKSDNQDSGVLRKGRGTFRGPTSNNESQQQEQAPRAPRGRDFDATSLRQYPPKGSEKPQKGNNRKKSKSVRRQNSNDGQVDSESGDSGSDGNITDEVNKLALTLETTSIIENGKEIKQNMQQQYNEVSSPSASLERNSQQSTVEEWEKVAESDLILKGSVFAQIDSQSDYRQKTDGQKTDNGQRPFKKGHKKSKSSKIEFNFDPDAYEGSTRILDIFDFPASFKTHHLHEIFQEYESMRGGYRIKWMDDTRALIIFEHPATARKAYLDNVNNQMAQIKPYDGPTDFLQKKDPNNAQPRARPVTTDMVAKRLVAGALGVRVQKSPEQRQAERQLLQNARETREQKRFDTLRRSQDLDAAFNE
ncbi:3765_t:CDS:2 [Ambispora gerdemannii]|uniref:3765_t:CDS:1 n=1 Tax=Ambispora gerdemannii TaxID=144530 RepID=A0A9N8YZ93_9GLOM|nr:3765_t:CDS:2 [Ambispora gerdemannii]